MERFSGYVRGMWFWLGVSMAAGYLLAAYAPTAVVAAVLVAALAGGLVLGKKRPHVWIAFVGCLFAIAYFHCYDHAHRPGRLAAAAAHNATVEAEGMIDSAVKQDGDVARFFLRVDAVAADGVRTPLSPRERLAVRVRLTEERQTASVERWAAGQPFHGRLHLRLPDPARNPGVFDYARYLRWQGVFAAADTVYSEVRVDVSAGGVRAWFDRWRKAEEARIEQLWDDPVTAGYLQSLLLGEADAVEPALAEMYRDLGLIHVLAISGLHVTLVSGMLLWIWQRFGQAKESGVWFTVVLLVGYVMLVGASPSAVRSGLMGGIGLGAAVIGRRIDVRDVWGLALTVMLLYDPYQLWQAGFQLSFAVTLGLIVYVPIFCQSPYPRARWIKTALAVTTAAQLVSFPFLLYWFHQASPLSWAVNLVAVPILSWIVLTAGYLALLFAHVHPVLALLPARAVDGVLGGVHAGLAWLYSLRVPFSHWPHPDGWWLVAFALWLAAVPFGWRRGYQRRRDLAVYGLCLLLLVVLARQPFSGSDEVRITFLDVGQGDSIVVEVGNQTVYLIDGGGTVTFPKQPWQAKRDPFDVGDDILLPFLRSRGIERIDRLVMTHGDYDHIGGFVALLPHVCVGAALVNGASPEGTERELVTSLKARGIPIVSGRPGASWSDNDHVRWTWLHPGGAGEWTGNDASVVLLLSAYGVNVLFTGDLETPGETHLLASGMLPRVDVLKVGHHGSGTSTSEAFLRETKPRAAVISVGRRNRYGHPAEEVLERLKRAGAAVYRTDEQGAITLTISPRGMVWQTQVTDEAGRDGPVGETE